MYNQTNFKMTNFKKNGTWLVSLAALTLSGLTTACSSDDDVIDTPSVPTLATDAITTGSDPAAQAYRITYLSPDLLGGTRAGETAPSDDYAVLPDKKTVQTPKDAPHFATKQDVSHVFDTGTAEEKAKLAGGYVLTGDDTESPDQIRVTDGPIYITGQVLTTNFHYYGDNGATADPVVYVMPGAKLILRNANMTTKVKIYSYGDLEIQGEGDLTNGNGATVLASAGDIRCTGNYAICGKTTCQRLIVEKKLQINYGSRLNAKCIEVHGTGLDDGDEAINMGGGSEMIVRSYLTTPKFYNQGGRVFFYPGAMAEISERTKMTSNGALFAVWHPKNPIERALLKTSTFEVEGSADDAKLIGQMFGGKMKLIYTDALINKQPATTALFPASAIDCNIKADPDGCNPGNVGETVPEAPKIDPWLVIESPSDPHTHTHLSATCLQNVGGTAYVCYHLNEAYNDLGEYVSNSRHQGCVEEIKVDDTHGEITSWMMNDNFDFNHLLVSGSTLYTIGDNKKGGAIGMIRLENGGFGQHEIGDNALMTVKKLQSQSGNCLIERGGNLLAAGTKGIEEYTMGLDSVGFTSTPGIAKHIVTGNEGYPITLNLTADKSDATVTTYASWGVGTAFNVGQITPANGKNVIATDGQSVYVCCGENGVKKYSIYGNFEAEFNYITWKKAGTNPNYAGHPCANGLAIDGDKVYVAYGGAGLVVLNKSDLSYQTRYCRLKDDKSGSWSANYVHVIGDKAYIAYGRDGLEVVKLTK